MRVLVIETGAFVRKGLSEQGMIVDRAEDGRSGLWLAQNGQYDMAIVDVMLPELDGRSAIRAREAARRGHGDRCDSREGQQRKQGMTQIVPLGRLGHAEEIAKAVLFVASNDSSYVTGAELFVD